MSKKLMSMAVNPADLEGLLNSCRRNGRPARFVKPEPKFFTDAERFRWWFRYGCKEETAKELFYMIGYNATLQKIRYWLDAEMTKHPEQVHT